MLLAVDPAFAKCGWALSNPVNGRPAELGVIVTEQSPHVIKRAKKRRPRTGHVEKSTDRGRRLGAVCRQLLEIAGTRVTAIAAEQALGHGPAAAVAANLLPWGSLVMLAVVLNVPLIEVPAKTWQHAVLGVEDAVDRKKLEKHMAAFIGRHAGDALTRIAPALHNHAIDAVGVGMLAALCPRQASRIVNRRAEGAKT